MRGNKKIYNDYSIYSGYLFMTISNNHEYSIRPSMYNYFAHYRNYGDQVPCMSGRTI